MKFNTKSIIKKVALVLAGVVAVSAVGVGVAKLIEYMQDDLKTISPSFDVGNLGADGKYVNDESTLYTKEAFQCDGLQIKLDFDNEIDYQIFFYDDLDNFIESTEVLSAAYSETVHDGYARIVIMPTNDEDDKIGLTERLTYPGQMTIKVAKEQNVEYVNIFNKRLRIVNDIASSRFYLGAIDVDDNGNYFFSESTTSNMVTNHDLIAVDKGSTLTCNYESEDSDIKLAFTVYAFKLSEGKISFLERLPYENASCKLNELCSYIIISASFYSTSLSGPTDISNYDLSGISSYFTITK